LTIVRHIIDNSGVAVAAGVDIGQKSADEIDSLDIPGALEQKLGRYAGMKGQAAVNHLAQNPLTLSAAEADAQTVIISYTRRYGRHFGSPNAKGKYADERKKFWQAAPRQDWDRAATVLLEAANDVSRTPAGTKDRRASEAKRLGIGGVLLP
jgi:hypothetical protein